MFHLTNSELLLAFILAIIVSTLTAYYAEHKGRNPFLWFVLGLVLGAFAPLILLFLPPVQAEEGNKDGPTMTVLSPDPSLQTASSRSLQIESKHQEEEDKLWYYLDQNHQQIGPVSVVALRELWNRGMLELNHYVWSSGMGQWEKVENLPELKTVLNKS